MISAGSLAMDQLQHEIHLTSSGCPTATNNPYANLNTNFMNSVLALSAFSAAADVDDNNTGTYYVMGTATQPLMGMLTSCNTPGDGTSVQYGGTSTFLSCMTAQWNGRIGNGMYYVQHSTVLYSQ